MSDTEIIDDFDGLVGHPDRIKKIFDDIAAVLNEAKKAGVNLSIQVENRKKDVKENYESLEKDTNNLRKEQSNAYQIPIGRYSDKDDSMSGRDFFVQDSLRIAESKRNFDNAKSSYNNLSKSSNILANCSNELFNQNKKLSDFLQVTHKMNSAFSAYISKISELKKNSNSSQSSILVDSISDSDAISSGTSEEKVSNEAKQKLMDYMCSHNYSKNDYAEYSQDPEWRKMHLAAYPNSALPPLDGDNGSAVSINEYFEDDFYYDRAFVNDNYESYTEFDTSDINQQEEKAISYYTLDGYSHINRTLYDENYNVGTTFMEQKIQNDIDTITECIDRKIIPADIQLFRGLGSLSHLLGDEIDNLSIEEANTFYKNQIFVNKGFSSTTTSAKGAMQFASGKYGGILVVDVPAGSKGIVLGKVSEFKNTEKEVLLQRGAAFRINSIKNGPGNKLFVYVKMISSY